ncbi:MAG: sigma-70 family RNA polymerase sigma factor [Planctomycetota bacterium]|nr:MAG: sigma-70 family RNA polymerase sigma factor [Planctomycetota bacterium]
MEDRRLELTRLLQAGAAGDELLPLVYEELRLIARRRMLEERAGHTLQATALVHEAWFRVAGSSEVEWRNRRHFYAAAAEAMRRILIDHARRAKSQKRGGGARKISLGAADAPALLDADQVLGLSVAFERLAEEDPEAAEVTRLRFYAGLSAAETAAALEISERTVHRKWTYARARLFELLGGA